MHQPHLDPRANPPRRGNNPWIVVLIVLGACGLFALAGIAVLAAVLFPVFGNARDAARQSACMSNAKSMSMALMMYSQDYDQLLPPARSWQTATAPYQPSDPNTCPTRITDVPAYAFHLPMDSKNLAKLEQPDREPMIFESNLVKMNGAGDLKSFVTPHQNRGIVGFGDGHVKALSEPPSASAPEL